MKKYVSRWGLLRALLWLIGTETLRADDKSAAEHYRYFLRLVEKIEKQPSTEWQFRHIDTLFLKFQGFEFNATELNNTSDKIKWQSPHFENFSDELGIFELFRFDFEVPKNILGDETVEIFSFYGSKGKGLICLGIQSGKRYPSVGLKSSHLT